MLSAQVVIYHDGISTTDKTPEHGSKWEPRLFEQFRADQSVADIYAAGKEFPAQVSEWLVGSGLTAIFYGHFHDGTLIFELEAAANLSFAAKEHMEREGGKWETSYVWLTRTDKPAPKPWMHHEQGFILMRRLP